MTRSEFVFLAIDVLFHPSQNYRRYKGMVREEEFVYDENRPEVCTAEYYYDPELLKSGKKLPVVLNIHGGGFVKGDKKHRHSLCKRFAKHGYFVMNINYGLGPKDPYPQGVIDCANAINYLEKTAEKYNIDIDKVCITGDSAGAYMATYVEALAVNKELCEKIGAPEIKVKPALLVSFCGPYDLMASVATVKLPCHLVWDIGRCYLGFEFGLKKDLSNINDYPYIKEIGPSEFVNPEWCPSFLVMAEKDVFCKGQGEILEKKLKDNNVEVVTFSSHKLIDNHCFHMNMGTKISKECFKEAFKFMDAHLKTDV
ncbi:MAG: alpha/beta hydrolase fold domain-containing protein [Eubacteriales bacterium]|nr:alpha/beta hydrolase fold domain-containing protein [Eubacteriales bacterium]